MDMTLGSWNEGQKIGGKARGIGTGDGKTQKHGSKDRRREEDGGDGSNGNFD